MLAKLAKADLELDLEPLVEVPGKGSQPFVHLMHKVHRSAPASPKDLGRGGSHRDLALGSTVETPISAFAE